MPMQKNRGKQNGKTLYHRLRRPPRPRAPPRGARAGRAPPRPPPRRAAAAAAEDKQKPQYVKPVDLVLTLQDLEHNATIRLRSRKKCLLSRALLHTLDDLGIQYTVRTK